MMAPNNIQYCLCPLLSLLCECKTILLKTPQTLTQYLKESSWYRFRSFLKKAWTSQYPKELCIPSRKKSIKQSYPGIKPMKHIKDWPNNISLWYSNGIYLGNSQQLVNQNLRCSQQAGIIAYSCKPMQHSMPGEEINSAADGSTDFFLYQ